jgi:hypothetical protein
MFLRRLWDDMVKTLLLHIFISEKTQIKNTVHCDKYTQNKQMLQDALIFEINKRNTV